MEISRWKNRFQNFHKALLQLEKAAVQTALSDLEGEGLIQRFEFTFELAWKTLQDLLSHRGYHDIMGPRPVLEQALKDGLINDNIGWAKMLKSRNETTHTYDETTSKKIIQEIRSSYFPLLKELYQRLKEIE
jgi:nucleotidyltransferase substrate binding protein (TIGR01987 family)